MKNAVLISLLLAVCAGLSACGKETETAGQTLTPTKVTPSGPVYGEWSEASEGLRGRLVVSQTPIEKSEMFEVYIELENVSHTALAYQVDNPYAFSATLTGEVGARIPPTSCRIDIISSPAWGDLPRRTSARFNVASDWGAAKVKGSQLDIITSIWAFDPGKYNLGGSYDSTKFTEDLKTKKKPENAWTGLLELPPVEIEVLAD